MINWVYSICKLANRSDQRSHSSQNLFRRLSLVFLAASFIPSLAHGACTAQSQEDFQKFFQRFSESKQFAVSRTIYPLKIETSFYGIDAQGKDISGKNVRFRSAKEDSTGGSLSTEMKQYELSYRIQSLKESSAVVNVSGEGDGILFNHHFTRKGNCWFQVMIEDYSI